MTKREIASLVIKLMGVFSGIFSAVRTHDGSGFLQTMFAMMMFFLAAVIPVAWSLLIIFFSDKASVWLIKDERAIENVSTSISKEDVMTIAVSCIGLFFIVAAVPQIISSMMFNFPAMLRRMSSQFTGPSGSMNLLRQLVIPAVQIGLGIWLFAGSKGIVKLWKKIRS
jgi:hypothetical protein